jgi:hypothetical protein
MLVVRNPELELWILVVKVPSVKLFGGLLCPSEQIQVRSFTILFLRPLRHHFQLKYNT